MKAAARRQMDYEKIQERKIQKEREGEGDLWADKETFVTNAYRKKMEERQRIEEEEKRQEQIEALLDVRKQKDLSGFYTSLLKMKSGEMVIEEESEIQRRLENQKKTEADAKFKEINKETQKNYRTKRAQSDDESDNDEEKRIEENGSQLKTESESGNEKIEIGDAKKQLSGESESKRAKVETALQEPSKNSLEEKENHSELLVNVKQEKNDEIEMLDAKVAVANKLLSAQEQRLQRRDQLFKKRTIDEKFEQELSDYFVRRSTVLSLKQYIEKD
jgi:coiled-coil domain-containing protein 55